MSTEHVNGDWMTILPLTAPHAHSRLPLEPIISLGHFTTTQTTWTVTQRLWEKSGLES